MPRVSHGDWTPAFNRPDTVAVLKAEEPGLLQDLIPIKYGHMLDSAFAFYRGSAAVMRRSTKTPSLGSVQLAGDAHLSNFGAYGTPERRLVLISMILMRLCPDRGNGTSRDWWPVWLLPVGTPAERNQMLGGRGHSGQVYRVKMGGIEDDLYGHQLRFRRG